MTSSNECRDEKGVYRSDYNTYLNQIWYSAQASWISEKIVNNSGLDTDYLHKIRWEDASRIEEMTT